MKTATTIPEQLGRCLRTIGETRRAIQFHEEALLIHREIGDRRGEGNAREQTNT